MRTISLGLMIGLLSIAASHTWAGKQDAVLLKEAAQNSVLVRDIVKYADETGVTLTGKLANIYTVIIMNFKIRVAALL